MLCCASCIQCHGNFVEASETSTALSLCSVLPGLVKNSTITVEITQIDKIKVLAMHSHVLYFNSFPSALVVVPPKMSLKLWFALFVYV